MGAFVKTCPRRTVCPLASLLVCLRLVSLFPHCWTQLHLTEMHRYGQYFFSTEGRGRLNCRKCHSSEKSTSGSPDKHARKQRASIKLLPGGRCQADLTVSLQHCTQWLLSKHLYEGSQCTSKSQWLQATSSLCHWECMHSYNQNWVSELHWTRSQLQAF